jgi:hypothetical protein
MTNWLSVRSCEGLQVRAQHDGLEVLQLFRPNAQKHEFEQPAKQHVERRCGHEASSAAGRWPNSTQQPIPIVFPGPATRPDPGLGTLQAMLNATLSATQLGLAFKPRYGNVSRAVSHSSHVRAVDRRAAPSSDSAVGDHLDCTNLRIASAPRATPPAPRSESLMTAACWRN